MPDVQGSRMIRVGILGLSDIALRKFIPALLKSTRARLVAVASRNRDRAALPAKQLSVTAQTYQELICNPDIDLVYVSLPNHLHEEWSIRSLNEGKHVICEKPLGLNAESVNRMLEAAEKNERFLYENLMYLLHPQHKAVKALLLSRRIGQLLSLRSEFAFPGPAAGDFRLNPVMGGGAFHDMNRYPLSAALNFLEGKTHRFFQGELVAREGLVIQARASSFTNAGETFSFMIAFGQPYRSFYELSGTLGFIRVERAYTTPADMKNEITVMVDSRCESFSVAPSDHFLNTIDHVCGLVKCGKWCVEYQQTRELAALAEMFQDNCIRRK